MRKFNKIVFSLLLSLCILFQNTIFISSASEVTNNNEITIKMDDKKVYLGDSSKISISFKENQNAKSLILTQICYDVTQKTVLNYNSKTKSYEGSIKYEIEPEALSVWSIKSIQLKKNNNKTETLNRKDLKEMGLNLDDYDVKQEYIIDNVGSKSRASISLDNYTDAVSVPVESISTKGTVASSTKTSQAGWPKGADTVIVVRASSSVDGICVAPLSKVYNAPILYTYQDSVPSVVMKEIKRLKPKNIILIGSEKSVKKSVYNELKNYNQKSKTNVKRIGGKNRYETSLLIAKEMDKVVDVQKVFMVNGSDSINYASAIAQKAIKDKQPIILIKKDSIPSSTYTWLKKENLKYAYYIGNSNLISSKVVTKMNKITSASCGESKRISGENLSEITANVIERFYKNTKYNSLVVVKTDSQKDVLLAQNLATKNNSLMIFIEEDTLNNCYKSIVNYKKINKIFEVGFDINKDIIEYIAYNMSIHRYGEYTVVLDAGHGGLPGSGHNWGGTTIINSNLWEKTYTLDTTLAAAKYLESNNVNVVLTRTKDVYVALAERTALINKVKPDLALSIHYNGLEPKYNGSSVYYRYAERKGGLTKTLAENVLQSIIDEFGFAREGTLYRTYVDSKTGKKVDYMHMIRESKYPTVLVEVCYVTNAKDQAKVNTKAKREKAGVQIAKGVLQTLDYMSANK